MPLRRVGVVIAVIVFLIALGRIGSIVVDWTWFLSIGYVGVFWTVFATKAALFVVVFAVIRLGFEQLKAAGGRLRGQSLISKVQACLGPWQRTTPSFRPNR